MSIKKQQIVKESLFSNEKEYELYGKINKSEEEYGFQYIKNILIPIVVEKHNSFNPYPNWSITNEELKKGLRKIKHHTYVIYQKKKKDVIGYGYKKEIFRFYFFMVKNSLGNFLIGFNDPGTSVIKFYIAGSNPPKKPAVSPRMEYIEIIRDLEHCYRIKESCINQSSITEDIKPKHNLKISKVEEEWAANVIRKYTISDPNWNRELINTRKIDQKRSENPEIPDEIDFETIYVSGINKVRLRYITRIRKNDEGEIEFFTVNKGFGHDRESTLYGIDKFIKTSSIKESYIDPSSNTKDKEFYVTDKEEEYAVRWIRKKFLPALIEDYNEIFSKHPDCAGIGLKPLFKINNPNDVIKGVQKINVKTNDKINYRSMVYFTKDGKDGAEFLFRIEKSDPHVVSVNYLGPFKTGYMRYELKPGGYPGNSFSFGKIKENIEGKPPNILTKEDEIRGLSYINKILLPYVFELYNSNLPGVKHSYIIRYGDDEKKIRHSLKKIDVDNNPLGNRITYKATWKDHSFYFAIQKFNNLVYAGWNDMDGEILFYDIRFSINDNNQFNNKRLGRTRNVNFISNFLLESVKPTDILTKSEIDMALQFIKGLIKKLNNGVIPKTFRRVDDRIPPAPNAVRYKCNDEEGNFNFRITKINGRISIVHDESSTEHTWYNPNDNIFQIYLVENIKSPNLHISKEEEEVVLQKLRNSTEGWDTIKNIPQRLGKTLRKINHYISDNPKKSDVITYGGGKHGILYFIEKDSKGRLCIEWGTTDDWGNVNFKTAGSKPLFKLEENIKSPNLHISKAEEEMVLQKLRNKTDGCYVGAKRLGKVLRKINHYISDDPKKSDVITYGGGENKVLFFIEKDNKGRLCIDYGFADMNGSCYFKSHNPKPFFLVENYPTGNWQGWEDITQPEKDRLKLVLKELQEYYKRFYHMNIHSQYVYLLQKVIDNMDVTDPRFAAKPLAQFGMEHRIFMGDFVDQKDTTGQASKVMDLLMSISRDYIEPPTPPKPDIELKGITDIVWPNGKSKGDVFIYGIEDMRPVINFGHGPYTLDDRFIEKYSKTGSQLYLDFGQEVKVVNMSDVMMKVKNAIDNYKKSLTEGLSDSPEYEKAIKKIINGNRFSKQEEDYVRQYLNNMVVDGERLGKSLVKIFHHITIDPTDSDMIVFSATIKGREKIYRVVKLNHPKIAHIRSGYVDGNIGAEINRLPLTEEKEDGPIVLTKEDELRAVQFLNNLVYKGQRLGKTLKKKNVMETGWTNRSKVQKSNIVVYSAKINIPHPNEPEFKSDTMEIPFTIFKDECRGVVIIDGSDMFEYRIDQKNPIFLTKDALTENVLNKRDNVILTKEDELRAVQFLSNLKIGNERVGKTLRKVKIEKSELPETISDSIIYLSKPYNDEEILFSIYRSLRLGLIIFNKTNYRRYSLDEFNH